MDVAEILHKVSQSIDSRIRDTVVQGNATAWEQRVAEQLHQASLLTFGTEEFLHVSVSSCNTEGNVHARAGKDILALEGVERIRCLYEVIDESGSSLGTFLQGVDATVVNVVLENKVDHVDEESGRGIVDRRNWGTVDHLRITQDRGADGGLVAYQIVTNDDDCDTSRAQILTTRCIDAAILADVNAAGQEGRCKITYQWRTAGRQLGVFQKLEPVDGFIGTDVDVGTVRRDVPVGYWWDEGICMLGTVIGQTDVAVLGGLLDSTQTPETCGDVIGLGLVSQKIHGKGGELAVCTALHEDDVVVGWDIEDGTKIVSSCGDRPLDGAACITVAHLEGEK